MTSKLTIIFACSAVLLCGCDRINAIGAKLGFNSSHEAAQVKAPTPPDPNAPRERREPIVWDEGFGAFWYKDAPLNAARLWRFDRGSLGFSGSADLRVTLNGVEILNRLFDSCVRSPGQLEIDGSRHNLVLVRLTRLSDSPPWNGVLFWSTQGHGENQAYQTRAFLGDAPKVGETVTLAFDMRNPRKGGDDWIVSIINQIRFDTDDGAGSRFLLRQVAIVENPDPDVLKAPHWPTSAAEIAAAASGASGSSGVVPETAAAAGLRSSSPE